jgi:alpha/beta superfamily hydrolase
MTGAQPEAARSVRIPYSLTDTLEGKLRVFGRHARRPHRGLILLHPLSTLGGSMNDAVLTELWRAAQATKAFGAVLAYNQRGVGSSGGSNLGSAISRMVHRVTQRDQEKDAIDVFRAIEYMVGVIEEAVGTSRPVEICLVGYSYGSALACQAIDHKNVVSCIAISPPIGKFASFFLPAREHFLALLQIQPNDQRRRLVVIGNCDQYTTEETLIDFVLLNALKAGEAKLAVDHQAAEEEGDASALVRRRLALKEGVHERLLVEVFDRNDHFWANDLAAMVERVLVFGAA